MPDRSSAVTTIGVDIAKDSFTVCLFQGKEETPRIPVGEFANSLQGHRAFQKWLKPYIGSEVHVVMEATGVYWETLAYYCHEKGWKVTVLNPTQIKQFRDMTLKKAKTDELDAVIIGCYALRNPVKYWTPLEPLLRDVRTRMRQRSELVKLRTMMKNQRHALSHQAHPPKDLLRTLNHQIQQWDRLILELEAKTWKLVQAHPLYKVWIQRLYAIPGYGRVTILTLLGETDAFKSFESDKKLTSYAGIVPFPNRSGSSVRHKSLISPFCNHRLRSALYLSAVSASKHNPVLHTFYRHLVDDLHKPRKVALIAVARKMLRIAFTLITQNRDYDPNYQENHKMIKTA
jgi:transposase